MKKGSRRFAFFLCVVIISFLSIYHFLPKVLGVEQGLALRFSFDESSGGLANDLSGIGNTGTLVNGPSWVPGQVGNALSFNGINQYVTVDNLMGGTWTGDYTIALWAKPAVLGQQTYTTLFNNYNNLGIGGTLDSSQIEMDGLNPGTYRLDSIDKFYPIAPVTLSWQHLAVTLLGTTLTTYNNGVLTHTYTLSPGESNTFRSYMVGINRRGNTFFKGTIDEVNVYQRALSELEIQALFTSTPTATPTLSPTTTPTPTVIPTPIPTGAPTKPNIIFILADDLGWQSLGSYGQTRIQTPNLDQMAQEGRRYTQAYAGDTVCCPSRAVYLTGQHTGHARLRSNRGIDPLTGGSAHPGPLLLRDVTVGETLKSAGYKTALIGKWHTGAADSSGSPTLQGFDYFYGHNIQTDGAISYYPSFLRENNSYVSIPSGTYVEDLYTQKAIDFIAQNTGTPFFLNIMYNTPHGPLTSPDFGPYANQPWSVGQKTYAAMHTRMDSNIGQILATLRNLGIDQNTLVIFTSDNGPEMCCSENIDAESLFDTAGPLRAFKETLYEGGIRVPFIARWPGKIPQNTQSDDLITFWDMLPTFAELANTPVPTGIDGISITPTLLGTGNVSREYLYWEYGNPEDPNLPQGLQAIRMGDWKGIRQFLPSYTFELFNLANDVSEQNNLAAANPSIVQKMEGLMTTGRTVASQDGFPMHWIDTALPCRQREILNNVELLSYSGTSNACAHLAHATVGEKIYTDGDETITSLPSYHQDDVLLRFANQDKTFLWSTFLRFAVRQPATVTVAYDANATVLPSWLESWTNSGQTAKVTGSATGEITYKLYTKSFLKHATVSLGGTVQEGANGTEAYFVMIDTGTPTQDPSGLIAHWKFDEPSGMITPDSSGYENDGLVYNGSILATTPERVSGKVGTALNFDGSRYYTHVKTGTVWQGDYSVALWAKPAALGQVVNTSLFANTKSFGQGGTIKSFQIELDGSTPGNYRLTTGTASYAIAPATTNWQFLAVTLTGTTLQTYANGSLTHTYTLSPGESNTFKDYLIGINRNGNRYFNGFIDEVRVYNRAISASEISNLFTSDGGTQPAFGFTLSNSNSISVTQGASASNIITATLTSGTSQQISFSASGLPSGAAASFSSGICLPTCSSTLTIATTPTTAPGTYVITVTVTGGGAAQSTTIPLLVNSTGGTPPPSGLIARWAFDEGSGTTANNSAGSGNTGSLFNGPAWVTGRVGTGALSFDGVNDLVRVNPATFNGTGPITISVWIHRSNAGLGHVLASTKFELNADRINRRICVTSNNNNYLCSPFNSLILSSWQHISVTRELNGSTAIYLNGQKIIQGSSGSPLSATDWAIGNFPSATGTVRPFGGMIDEMKIFNRVLTDSEILGLYTNP